jgi:hypothetical protein
MTKTDFNKSGGNAPGGSDLDPAAIFEWLFYQLKLFWGVEKPGEGAEVTAPAGLASLFSIFTGGNAHRDAPPTPAAQVPAPEAPKLPNGSQFVMYGDSHAQGFFDYLKGKKNDVHEMATVSAGLRTKTPVADATNVPAKSAVFVSIGTNDVGSLTSDAQLKKYTDEIRERIQIMRDKGCVVYLASVNPPTDGKHADATEKLNRAYAGIVAEMNTPNVRYFDMTPFKDLRAADKLHYRPEVFVSIGNSLSAG